MKKGVISPSMMCVDFSETERAVRTFEQEGIELLHIDIMDGEFVPNYALGTDYCEKLRKLTDIPLDLHLMITKPDEKLEWFNIRPREHTAIHWETALHMPRLLAKLHRLDAKPVIALNPATPLSVLDYVLDDIAGLLIMTVDPGFAGQNMHPYTLDKIRQARKLLDARGRTDIDIEVDGNVSFENAVKMREAGANIFVAGTSSIFSPDGRLHENIARLRGAIS